MQLLSLRASETVVFEEASEIAVLAISLYLQNEELVDNIFRVGYVKLFFKLLLIKSLLTRYL